MRIHEATSVQAVVVAGIFDGTAGRFAGGAASVLGLIGIAVAWRALVRSAGRARSDTEVGRTGALDSVIVAMGLGLIGIVVGALIVATSNGGVGTGDGFSGAIVAMVLGLIAVVVAWLARARRREVA